MARKVQPPPKNFELALRELEQIVAEIEAGEVGLEESITRYERGTFLIHHCRTVLATAERQIELLSRGSEGELVSEPLTDAGAPAGPGSNPATNPVVADDGQEDI